MQSSEGIPGANELISATLTLRRYLRQRCHRYWCHAGFKEHSIQVPRDISVIGIDDIETAQYMSPMLTTIHIPG